MDTLRSTEGLVVGSVYRRGEPHTLAETKRELYAASVRRFETELAATDSLGLVVMDGDGSDLSYRATHRSLPLAERRVIEDAIHLDSRASQLVQMADLVAWTANVTVDAHPKNAFAREWYANYLAVCDRHRYPQEL